MCGLCGVMEIAGRQSAPPDEALIRRMTETIAHRGPNDTGIWCDGRIGLGHRRLSVIDLSSAGHQPMFNEDGTVALVYNGEIYNFMELREKFRLDDNHRFQSKTDSEVIIHLYEELGLDMMEHLSGMFAIALWDAKKGVLHLARDRYGIKPLFYQKDDAHLRFGSEIKTILADDRVKRSPSMQALHDFLTFNYIPGTQSAFEGIHEVRPAHVLSVASDGEITERRYWDLRFEPDASITEKEAIERSYELMNESLARHLIADVPIGVFLSGGLDSSTLCALMKNHTKERIHTYSVGFEDQSFNELPFARIMAEECNTVHREVLVSADKVRAMLPKYLGYIDEPYGDGSAIPTYYVSEIAKDEVVVVLSGEGGDECFAGYETYKAFEVSQWFSKVPGFVRNGIIKPFANALPVSDKKLSFEFRLKRFLGGQDLPPEEAHMWWRIVLAEEQKLDLYTDAVRERGPLLSSVRHFRDGFAHAGAEETLSGLMYLDSTVFMPDDLMIKNDRMTMAHSLEARVPFTDPALTEYLATVPAAMKMKGGKKKYLMREAMRPHLPDPILNKKKVGLEMPYSRWLKSELNDLMMQYLGPDNIRRTGLFRPEGIQRLVEEHVGNKRDHGRPLWGLLNYMMWYDLYMAK